MWINNYQHKKAVACRAAGTDANYGKLQNMFEYSITYSSHIQVRQLLVPDEAVVEPAVRSGVSMDAERDRVSKL